ncbi:hypothetical protein GGR52DRAFT_521662 [Hypoxylon sp. FL1284]|nr:hypothetical protein GGR52DRAFT_521662 [Hypoxylon sp. FL1284]
MEPPTWNAAVEKWQTENPEQYAELGKIIMSDKGGDSTLKRVDELLHFKPSANSSHQTTARLKRWLPSLAAVRGIAMSVAALDPNKIAPVVCASIFFSIDILFSSMNPTDRDKILDTLCTCNTAISECISIEQNLGRKSHHPSIEEDMTAIKEPLIDQYIRALGLMADIYQNSQYAQHSYVSSKEDWEGWIKVRGQKIWNKLSNKILDWESKGGEISRTKSNLSDRKKRMEDKLAADAEIVKVLTWVKKEGDPEPKLDTIRQRLMPDGKYKDSGRWFIDSPEFSDWCQILQSAETHETSKRVLWVKGGLGTGKTTLLYQANSFLKESALQSQTRIIPYFCDASNAASKRPDYEPIIRSMASRLSLLPSIDIDANTLTMHDGYTSARGHDRNPVLENWEDLLRNLIESMHSKGYRIMFLVDALDECNEIDHNRLLKLMGEITKKYPNIRLLCTSHYQVIGSDYISSDIVQNFEVTKEQTKYEIKSFIVGEIDRRKGDAIGSIFRTSDVLCRELEDTLIKNANGMIRWVEIWLDILLPSFQHTRTIRKESDAREVLEQLSSDAHKIPEGYQLLESTYQRLWNMNDRVGYTASRNRLFHFVLGHSTLPTGLILEALRIREFSMDDDITTELFEQLYSNFLYDSGNEGLRFIHNSARMFVQDIPDPRKNGLKLFSQKNNDLAIANLYIEVMKSRDHPCWEAYQPPNPHRTWIYRWEDMNYRSILFYLSVHGLEHCHRAAESPSMFDELWVRMLDVIVDPSSAFCSRTQLIRPFGKISNWCEFISFAEEGGGDFHYLSLLAFLNIIDENYFSRFQSGELSLEDSKRHDFLFEQYDEEIRSRREFKFLTALRIACMSENIAAIKTILNAVYLRQDAYRTYRHIVKSGNERNPVAVALETKNLEILKTLLEFDREHPVRRVDYATTMPGVILPGNRKTEIWDNHVQLRSSPCEPLKPTLMAAIETFEESEVLSLLSIGSPRDAHVNLGTISDKDAIGSTFGETALDAAITRGYMKLAKELVEKYNATGRLKGEHDKRMSELDRVP